MPGLLETYPLRILVGGEDLTPLVAEGLTFSNVDGGGFEACSIPIPRDAPELYVGMPIRITSGLQTAWEGRIAELERSLGPQTTITGEGWGAVAKENMLSEVYVDRDLTRWTQPSVNRQIALVIASQSLQSFQLGTDPKGQLAPAIVETIRDSWAAPWSPRVEAWYDAGPENLVASVYYSLRLDSTVGSFFTDTVQLSDDDVKTTTETSANFQPSAPTSGYFSPATPYRFAVLNHDWTGTPPGGTQGQVENAYWKNVAAYGNHGLTGRGSDPVGFYTSDIARHALTQLPAGLINPGVIPDITGYIVPHYVQYVPVPVEQVWSDMAALGGCHWGTWESLDPLTGDPTPRFDFRPYPTTPTVWCMRQDCDTLDVNDALAGWYDSAQVTFTNVTGVQQAVSVSLDNPLLDVVGQHRTLQIDAGTATLAIAQTFGLLILALSQLNARATGNATFSGMVNTPGGQVPSWMMRAGLDRLRVVDYVGSNAFGTTNDFNVSRVETTVSTDGISTSVELGTGADLVEVTQSRLQAASSLASVL